MRFRFRAGIAMTVCCLFQSAWAQSAVDTPGGTYTCVDASGRKLTSDRPIPECNDRVQTVLNPSGTVRATLGPSLTAQERAAQEARARLELDARNRALEEKRRDRALLTRYPTRALHDRERAAALAQIEAATSVVNERLQDLYAQRRKLDEQMEFYASNPAKAPESLRRQLDENVQNTQTQQKLLDEQDEETDRVNRRFDDELARLLVLWPTVTQR